MVMAYLNVGSLDYFGVDVSVEAYLNDHWSGYANYSWFGDNFFTDEAIGLEGSGYVVSMNSPKEKFRAGIVYRTNSGLTITSGIRYVGNFLVADGTNYNGMVDS
jgi:outer membrane receptor for monomeric catechols